MAAFDPFEILGVSMGADDRTIKKAYRNLSLQWHPDKNPNNPQAAAHFIQITKAYAALTDEAAKANYEKYGNPDGPATMKVSVGLPTFLLEQENQLSTLIAFSVAVFVVLPVVFFWNFQRMKNYHNNGLLVESMQLIGHYLREDTRMAQLPELLALMAESRNQRINADDGYSMKAIHDTVEEQKKPTFVRPPVLVRNRALLWAHLQRQHALFTPALAKSVEELLKHALVITETMMECALSRANDPRSNSGNWLITAQSVIEFRRCLVQALDVKDSQLLQIPHVDQQVLRELQRGKKKVNTIADFFAVPKEERKGRLTPEQQLDVQAFGEHLPDVNFECVVSVDDEDEICAGDVAAVHITLTRPNLAEGEASGPVHAPYFPHEKFEVWYVFVTFQFPGMAMPRLLGSDRISSQEREAKTKIHFEVPSKGTYSFQFLAMCDSYAGIDVKQEITFTVQDAAASEYRIHKDDQKLESMSMIQQMLGVQEEEEDESDEDEKAKEEEKKKKKDDSDSSDTESE